MTNVNGTSVESNGGFLTAITGAVIGGATAGWGLAIIFLVAVIGGFVYVRMRRNKKKVKKSKK